MKALELLGLTKPACHHLQGRGARAQGESRDHPLQRRRSLFNGCLPLRETSGTINEPPCWGRVRGQSAEPAASLPWRTIGKPLCTHDKRVFRSSLLRRGVKEQRVKIVPRQVNLTCLRPLLSQSGNLMDSAIYLFTYFLISSASLLIDRAF